MEDLLKDEDLFVRLHKGEPVKCPSCKKGIIRPMSDGPIEQVFSFECDECKAHFRYDPVNVVVE